MVFNIQRYSIEDGPGIRTTVFLKGCPLRCLWCSNPESQQAVPELAHQDSLCTGCNDCLDVCAENAISIVSKDGNFSIRIDRDKCTKCGKCVEVCPAGVLEMAEDELDPLSDEIIATVSEDHRKKIKYSCAPCKPSGETNGKVGDEYTYSTSASDPNIYQVCYGWDWDGDLIVDEWTNYFNSGEEVFIPHIWNQKGKYHLYHCHLQQNHHFADLNKSTLR